MSTVIHVVDDELPVRRAFGRLLRSAGYDVATYESVQHLLDRLPELTESGCILLDVVMPGGDGRRLEEAVRRVGLNLPILYVTGSEDPSGEFLKKPVSKETLLGAIERALGADRPAD